MRSERQSPPAANRRALVSIAGDVFSLRDTVAELTHLQTRVVQDAMESASAKQWRYRAETFERARPTPTDHHGGATPEQLRAQWNRLTGIAAACRAKAALIEAGGGDPGIDEALLAELDRWSQ